MSYRVDPYPAAFAGPLTETHVNDHKVVMPSAYINRSKWSPLDNHESPRSSRFTPELVRVAHDADQTARVSLAHWEMREGGYAWLQHQDTVSHCHPSLQSLREEYEWAKNDSKEELATFVLKVLKLLPKVGDCEIALKNDLALARLQYQTLRETPFEHEQKVLDQELVAWKEKTAAALIDWNEKAAAVNKKYPGPLRNGKLHQRATEELLKDMERALKPYDDEYAKIENRVQALKTKMFDAKLIPEVLLKAEQEIESHKRIVAFCAGVIEEANRVFGEEDTSEPQVISDPPSPEDTEESTSKGKEELN